MEGLISDSLDGVHFVSSFRLKPGVPYLYGPVAHDEHDLAKQGTQVYVEPPLESKLELVTSREVLRHDAIVVQRPGTS